MAIGSLLHHSESLEEGSEGSLACAKSSSRARARTREDAARQDVLASPRASHPLTRARRVFLAREHAAHARFLDVWGAAAAARGDAAAAAADAAAAAAARAAAAAVARALDEQLWRDDLGYHAAYNVSERDGQPTRPSRVSRLLASRPQRPSPPPSVSSRHPSRGPSRDANRAPLRAASRLVESAITLCDDLAPAVSFFVRAYFWCAGELARVHRGAHVPGASLAVFPPMPFFSPCPSDVVVSPMPVR